MLWWSGKGYGVGYVNAMEKEKLCDIVIVVRRVSDRVMEVVLFLKRMF